jgi:RimJ/RimL family protein N-acetyltransferase
MTILLREFAVDHLPMYAQWRDSVGASQYMSRFFPHAFNGEAIDGKSLFAWYVVIVDALPIGTIWLEEDRANGRSATLGILIGEKSKLGAGIGRTAIPLAIAHAKSRLRFDEVRLNVGTDNARAISCYKCCGFSVVREGTKRNQWGKEISFWEMALALNPAISQQAAPNLVLHRTRPKAARR